MVDFDDARGLSPAEQWLRFMQSLPEDRGMWEMTRVPMSRQVEDGPPAKAKLVQDQYSCVNGFDTRVKSFYKANTTMTVNQHKKTVRPGPFSTTDAAACRASHLRASEGWLTPHRSFSYCSACTRSERK